MPQALSALENLMNMRQPDKIDPTWAWSEFVPDSKRPFDRRLAGHLFRRATFGATHNELNAAVENGLASTVNQLFACQCPEEFEADSSAMSGLISRNQQPRRLSSWWLYRMANTPCPFAEKMTLFWHGHFATSGAKVTDTRALFAQHQILRENALGKFEPMVQAISRDVAMLVYLDSTDNRKTRPNENYAREVMELFCLGLDQYTEKDIKELARCFTGWEVYRKQFRFNHYQHDDGEKTVLGKTGNFGGEEAIRIVVENPSASNFIARKLIRFFVFDDVELDAALVEPIALDLRQSNFDIGVAVRRILTSNLFFSEQAIGHKVKSPVELAIGTLRILEASTGLDRIADRLEIMGQLPFFPPNVKGWDGGRTWINASSLLGRANLVRDFVTSSKTNFDHGSLADWASQNGVRSDTELVDWLLGLFLPIRPDADTVKDLVALAASKSSDQQIASLISVIAALPEFQLS